MRAVKIPRGVVLVVLCLGSFALAAELHHIHGAVVSVDAAAKSLTVRETLKNGTTQDVAFTVDGKTTVLIHGKAGKLEEVKAGDAIHVRYHKAGSKNHTAEISIVTNPAKKP